VLLLVIGLFLVAIAILSISALIFLLPHTEGNEPPPKQENKWETLMRNNGILLNNSESLQISPPREVSPGVVALRVEETLPPSVLPGGDSITYVRTSQVYVNAETGEAFNAASYMTTAEYEKEKIEVLMGQLDS
jgi:hypothetical protein